MMVGRDVLLRIDTRPANPADDVLEVRGLSWSTPAACPLDDVSFTVRSGEIIGIAGVEGNGQSELLAAIAGWGPSTGGKSASATAHLCQVAQRRAAGLAYIPEDR